MAAPVRLTTNLHDGTHLLVLSTFLAIRILQNPRHYVTAVVKEQSKTWSETLDSYVENSLKSLEGHGLITWKREADEVAAVDDEVAPTSLGRIMSQNFIRYATMAGIATMEPDASLEDLLMILAAADEWVVCCGSGVRNC